MTEEPATILDVHDLNVEFPTPDGVCKALDAVDIALKKGEVLGLMGQSGSGKTLTATALMGMVEPPGRIKAESFRLNGTSIYSVSPSAMRQFRGREIFMIFQSPASALNPTLRIGLQLSEIMVHHHRMNWQDARNRSAGLLDQVQLSHRIMDAYPFELSGGMQQRVLIAMALAIRPRVLIADEPTTGLDAITQARILEMFGGLRKEMAEAILFISHDLRVLLRLTDRIAVMHAGRIVETTPTTQFLEQAKHPHTRAIITAFKELEAIEENQSC